MLKSQDEIESNTEDKSRRLHPIECVTILVPTLNEVENIDLLIERILSATKDNPFSIEIMIVDGGSKDGTQDKVKEWSRKAPVRLVDIRWERRTIR